MRATTDSDLVTELLAAEAADLGFEEAAMRLLPRLRGAFSLVFADERTLYAARDPHGVRPLVLGRLERGWVVASETAALDIVGASFVREVEPGELIAIDADGIRSSRFAATRSRRAACSSTSTSPARTPRSPGARCTPPASRSGAGSPRSTRSRPTWSSRCPESGTPAAIGYAQGSGIPYGQGLVKNAYVGRTFIQPSQTIRQLGIRLKLNPLRDVIRGKRLVVVDDSIVRGNTQRALVRMLREAGALEVHVRIASPPVRWPCFYGIDFATRAELIAGGRGRRGRAPLDRVGHARLRLARRPGRRHRAAAQPAVLACFDGDYPIPLPDEARLGKHLLEDVPADRRSRSVSGAASGDPGPLSVGYGAAEALTPPLSPAPAGTSSGDVAPRSADELLESFPMPRTDPDQPRATYAAAGVDIDAGERAVEALRPFAEKATRPEVLGGIGGFAGPVRGEVGRYAEPVLAASTDGVGTKVAIAQAMDKHDTIGLDLVAMVVDDLVVCGAEPLFLQDYIAVGRLVPEQVAAHRRAASRRAASRPAARCWAARPPSTPG